MEFKMEEVSRSNSLLGFDSFWQHKTVETLLLVESHE